MRIVSKVSFRSTFKFNTPLLASVLSPSNHSLRLNLDGFVLIATCDGILSYIFNKITCNSSRTTYWPPIESEIGSFEFKSGMNVYFERPM